MRKSLLYFFIYLTIILIISIVLIYHVNHKVSEENVENTHQTNYSTLNPLDNISISYKKAYFTLFLYYPGEAKYVGYEITNNSILFKFEHLSENVSLRLIKVKELIEFQDEPDVRVLVFVNGTPESINVVKGLDNQHYHHAIFIMPPLLILKL